MKATIVVPTRFHALHTAAQLFRQDALASVVTGVPWSRLREHTHLPRRYIRSLPYTLIPVVAARRLPARLRSALAADAFAASVFDWTAARCLPAASEICIGYAGLSLHTLRAARARNMLTVVERHSVHRRTQMELLAAEHDALGLEFHADSDSVERELEEYETADVISVPSEFVAQSFVERGFDRARILKAPLGADLRSFTPVPRTDHRFRVVFAGTFSAQKGVHYLLRAWAQLRLRDAELLFVGSVDPALRTVLQPELQPGVRMLAPVPQRRLAELFSNADVLCLPSVQDGFGMVMAEAMACGLPVIHSKHTGGADLVESGVTGFEVPVRDPAALAEAIQVLFDDRERCRAMGQAALAKARSLGGWDAYGDLYVEGLRRHLRERFSHG